MTLSLCCFTCGSDTTVPALLNDTPERVKEEDSAAYFHNLLHAINEVQELHELVRGGDRQFKSILQQLDFGAYFINEYVATEVGVQMQLKYLVQDSTVLYALVTSIDSFYRSRMTDLMLHHNEQGLQQYANQHQQFYGKAYSAEQLITELFTAPLSIQIACGNGTFAYGDTERQVFKAVRDRDLAYINELLRSVAPERQALGVIALQKLMEAGYELPESSIKLKNHLLERNSRVSACVSCSYGGTYELQDYLSRYRWELIPNIDLD
ncbi:MAG: hypothetical protein AAFO03_24025 [Bacteroidota bacterium]